MTAGAAQHMICTGQHYRQAFAPASVGFPAQHRSIPNIEQSGYGICLPYLLDLQQLDVNLVYSRLEPRTCVLCIISFMLPDSLTILHHVQLAAKCMILQCLASHRLGWLLGNLDLGCFVLHRFVQFALQSLPYTSVLQGNHVATRSPLHIPMA